MIVYISTFVIALCISLWLTWKNNKSNDTHLPEHVWFQRKYLIVYVCAYFADWLQGPYVYALYESYGFSEDDIARLFVAGFATSGIVGPFVGTLADKCGRKNMCLAYFIIYIMSVFTKPFVRYDILMTGRVLGGIGTSILCTTFESWMVSEHKRRDYPQELLDDTFAKSSFYNSMTAIVAGVSAQLVANEFGYVAPFALATIPLIAGVLLTFLLWECDVSTQTLSKSSILDSFRILDTNLIVLGLSQALFSGAMYVFVFLWTPALGSTSAPYGLIFSIFMVMISIGTNIFKRYSNRVIYLPYWIMGGAAISCVITSVFITQEYVVFASFAFFECICGIMFPTYGTLRSEYIPEEHRTTIMNIYRVPLNAYVTGMLVLKKHMSIVEAFTGCFITYLAALMLWNQFKPNNNILDSKEYKKTQDKEEDFGELDA